MGEAQRIGGDFLVGPEEQLSGHRGSAVEGCTRLGNQSRPEGHLGTRVDQKGADNAVGFLQTSSCSQLCILIQKSVHLYYTSTDC